MFLVSMGGHQQQLGRLETLGQYRACIIRIGFFFVFFFHYQLIRTVPFSMYFLAFVFPLLYIYMFTLN